MIKPGLVSVSFREHSPAEIMAACCENKISFVEWGSDIHAPVGDLTRLNEIAAMQRDMDITCCSYGTYFRVGKDNTEEIHKYIKAARILGTERLRIWCGTKGSSEYDESERKHCAAECTELARIAETESVTLCTEFHGGTLTDCAKSVMALSETVASENFKTYWQPNQFTDFQWNIDAAKRVAAITENIHVFNWRGNDRFPLDEAIDEWKAYLEIFKGEHYALLEFMPDGKLASLPNEWRALNKILETSL